MAPITKHYERDSAMQAGTIMQGFKVLDTKNRRNSGRLIFIAVAASVVFALGLWGFNRNRVCSSG